MPFCPRCGKKNPVGAEYCSKCGGSLALIDEPERHTRLGIASLILGIIAFFSLAIPTFIFGILAVIFGAKSYWNKYEDSYGLVGLILGIIGLVFNILLLLAYLSGGFP